MCTSKEIKPYPLSPVCAQCTFNNTENLGLISLLETLVGGLSFLFLRVCVCGGVYDEMIMNLSDVEMTVIESLGSCF